MHEEKLRILQIAPPFLPIREDIVYGGIERIVWYLDRAYKELGHESSIAAPADSSPLGKLEPTINASIGDFNTFNREGTFLRIEHIAETIKHANSGFDVVHAHDDNLLPFLSLIESPSLLTLHSHYPDFWQSKNHPKLADETKNLNLVAVSHALKEQYEKDGFSVRFVVHNGIEVDKFIYADKKRDYLLSLGLISPTKGVHYAVQTAKSLNKDLIIAGTIDGQCGEYFDEQIKPHITHDISDKEDKLGGYLSLPKGGRKIVYVGGVNDVQKKPLFANAEVFLLPTCLEDSLPTVVIESAASGTPVVAFGRGGVPEMIEDCKTGFIVEKGNLGGMINAARESASINPKDCRKFAEDNFGYKRMAQDYLSCSGIDGI
ncbi:glycosyltransferase [Candidatus Pacearchaeota archaeon]|nr:glycosyltransferase [Candidatus Pacearchaeota archaeon]